jgi:hypothetical protein
MVNPQKLSESVMASEQQKQGFPAQPPLAAPPSGAETARYTLDMLENLRKIAVRQGQDMLAHLLELAQAEARILVRDASAPNGADR